MTDDEQTAMAACEEWSNGEPAVTTQECDFRSCGRSKRLETMTEKQKDELLKHVVGAIGAIKAQFEVEVIKDYEIPPLVNTKTIQDIGFGVKLQLNTRYDYDEEMLTQWKNMLKADEWYISVKRNQLHVTFKVRYKEG